MRLELLRDGHLPRAMGGVHDASSERAFPSAKSGVEDAVEVLDPPLHADEIQARGPRHAHGESVGGFVEVGAHEVDGAARGAQLGDFLAGEVLPVLRGVRIGHLLERGEDRGAVLAHGEGDGVSRVAGGIGELLAPPRGVAHADVGVGGAEHGDVRGGLERRERDARQAEEGEEREHHAPGARALVPRDALPDGDVRARDEQHTLRVAPSPRGFGRHDDRVGGRPPSQLRARQPAPRAPTERERDARAGHRKEDAASAYAFGRG